VSRRAARRLGGFSLQKLAQKIATLGKREPAGQATGWNSEKILPLNLAF